jgi:hypothetical protein
LVISSEPSVGPFRPGDPKVCPYCGRCPSGIGVDVYTDDHIFLEAIGGRRTIRACKPCNDRFGYSFEAETIQHTLHPLLILLGDGGVPVLDPGAKWKYAFVTNGLPHHLKLGPDGMVAEGARIVVERKPDSPNSIRVVVNEDDAMPKLLRQFSNSKKFHVRSYVKLPSPQNDRLKTTFNMDNAMRMTALKMAFAVATIAMPGEIENFAQARQSLSGAVEDLDTAVVRVDHRQHLAIDEKRQHLCHTIYVEQSQGIIHGIVQFFGSFQLWVRLSAEASRSSDTAILATLDPVSGAESFTAIPNLNIPVCRGDELVNSATPVNKFNLSAAWRGSRRSEVLRLEKITANDGAELLATKPYFVASWTGDMPRKPK